MLKFTDFDGLSIIVQDKAALSLQQSYETRGGTTLRRALNGAAIKQNHWQRESTNISSGGWLPPGIEALNYDKPISVHCIAPKTKHSPTNISALAAGSYRTDTNFAPFCHAIMSDGSSVPTASSITADTITATPIAGAVYYAVVYHPIKQYIFDPPQLSFDHAGGTSSWSMKGEEP